MERGAMIDGAGLDRVNACGGWVLRVLMGLGALGFLLLCLATGNLGSGGIFEVGVAAVAAAAALSIRRLVPLTIIAGVLSLVLTAGLAALTDPSPNPAVLLEEFALLVLIARIVWRVPRPLPIAGMLAVALVTVPLRESVFVAAFASAPIAVAGSCAFGAGYYLRALDERRARALHDARRDERLDLARELHDFVAHHVTGIVVQAQAARFVSRSGAAQSPEQVERMLGEIERSGTEALTSMRRLVGLLREGPGEGEAETRPVDGLDRVEQLVAGFNDPPATLMLDPSVGPLPPEVAASVHRIVQEALTNVRKHAADASRVSVVVVRRAAEVEVSVRDDGRGAGRRLPSSGFGLAGLNERMDAVGGRLHAGPRPEGGWEVVAMFPLEEKTG